MVTALPLRTRFLKQEWQVRTTSLHIATQLVETFHYARGASPNGVYLHGLYLSGDPNCWGVAWWLPSMRGSVNKWNPGGDETTLTLHRLVIHPLVPTNGASFLLGRSIRLIGHDGKYDMLLTYADTWRGHTGQIYRATNWEYQGLTAPLPVWVDANGVQASTSSRLMYGGERAKSPTRDALRERGYTMIGRFQKHVYTMRLRLKPQSRQLTLFEVTA